MYIALYITLMPKRYSIADARANLPSIVDEVEAGGEIELTRRGRSVAYVVPRRLYDRMRGTRPSFDEAYASFLRRFNLEEVGLDDDAFDGIRDAHPGRPVDL